MSNVISKLEGHNDKVELYVILFKLLTNISLEQNRTEKISRDRKNKVFSIHATVWVSVKPPLATDPLGCGGLLQSTTKHPTATLETAILDFMF